MYSTISESRKIVSNIEGGIVMKKEFKEIYIYCFVTDSFGTLNYQEKYKTKLVYGMQQKERMDYAFLDNVMFKTSP